MGNIDWETISKKVEKQVLKKLKKDLVDWEQDLEMKSMFLRDAADGLDVANILKTGNWLLVEKRLWEMDTAAREYVYEYIETSGGKKLKNFLQKV